MRCVICSRKLPTNNYALVEGEYFCVPCLLEQNLIRPTPCQNCGTIASSSDSKRGKLGSTTSLNSTKSARTSAAARRVGTAISRTFQRLLSSASTPSVPIPDNQKPPRPTKTRRETCQVCFDEKKSAHFCPISDHECHQTHRTICDACTYRHIQQAFQEMCTDDVRCPELECGIKLSYDTIRKILLSNKDTTLFERYDRFVIHHQLEQMDEFIWCSNSNCQMGQMNDGGQSNNIVTCIHCHKKTCFTHKIPWHQGLTCKQYDATINGDLKATLRWLNQNTKKCPKCPYQIEKNDGCDHITCIKCQHEFCWSCLADYDQIRRDGNHRHHSHCKHHAPYDEH